MEALGFHGNTVHKILSKHITGYTDLSISEQRRCCSAVLAYLFRVKSLKELVQFLSNVTNQKQSVKVSAFQNGYLLKNIKLWLFYCYRHNIASTDIFQDECAEVAKKFEILEADLCLLDVLDATTNRMLRMYARKYKALSLAKLDATIVRIFQTIRVWCHKFIHRKLRFVMTSQSMTVHDIEYELIGKGIQGLMQMYPLVENFLHAVNIVKRTLHNHGINIITSYTHHKRARVLQGADNTFYSNTVSYEALQTVMLATDTAAVEETKDGDLKMDIERLCHRLKHHKQRYFVRLLSGYECPTFSDWLRQKGRVRHQATNADLQDRIPSREYIRLILEYLRVPFDKGMAFVNKLREVLAHYRYSEPEHVIAPFSFTTATGG